jgi:hypothetical protein
MRKCSDCIVRECFRIRCAHPMCVWFSVCVQWPAADRPENTVITEVQYIIASMYDKLGMNSNRRRISLWFMDAVRILIPNLFLITRANYSFLVILCWNTAMKESPSEESRAPFSYLVQDEFCRCHTVTWNLLRGLKRFPLDEFHSYLKVIVVYRIGYHDSSVKPLLWGFIWCVKCLGRWCVF